MGSSHLRLWVQFDVWRVSQSTHTISWEWDTNPTMLICSQWSDMGSHMWDMWQCMAPPTGCTNIFPFDSERNTCWPAQLTTEIWYRYNIRVSKWKNSHSWHKTMNWNTPIQKSPNVETNIVVYIHKKKIFSINIRLSRNTFKGIVRIKTFINTDFIRYNFILIFVHSLTSIIKIVRHWRHCKSNPNVHACSSMLIQAYESVWKSLEGLGVQPVIVLCINVIMYLWVLELDRCWFSVNGLTWLIKKVK